MISERRRIGAANADAQVRLIRKLREIRVARGVQVADVAVAMGVDPAMVYRFEKGGTNYTAATLRKYAKAVGALLHFDATDASLSATPMGNQRVRVADTIHDHRAASNVLITMVRDGRGSEFPTLPTSPDISWGSLATDRLTRHVTQKVTQTSVHSESVTR